MQTHPLTETLLMEKKGVISLIGGGGKTTLMFRLANELKAEGLKVLTTTTTKIAMPSPDQSSQFITSIYADEIIEAARISLKTHHHITAVKEIGAASTHCSGLKKCFGLHPEIVDKIWESGLFDWIIVEADGAKQKPLKACAPHEPVIPKTSTQGILLAGLDALGCPLDDNSIFRSALVSRITGVAEGDVVTESCMAELLSHEIDRIQARTSLKNMLVFLNKADHPELEKLGCNVAALMMVHPAQALKRIVVGVLNSADAVRHQFDNSFKIKPAS